MTIMAKKRKKKGRPSLLDLQKRSLKQQQQLQKQIQNPNSLNFSSNPTKRSDEASLPPPEFFTAGDDDDDERKEKKHKLLLGFNSNSDGLHRPTLSSFDKNAVGGEDLYDVDHKRRKISAAAVAHHGSNQMSEKALKATDSSCSVHGLQVETGPTTPLPDKKLLVFILDRLQKKDTYGVFSEPVDPEELPDYHEIIENPMDFGTVRKKLDGGAYTNLEQFEKDVFLICSNAMEYNSSDTIYFRQARSIHELAKKDFENLRQDSDDDDGPQPKIVRRGRPPGKKVKKLIESSPVDYVGHESFSDAALASGGENANGSNTYNLRRVRNSNMFRHADAVNRVFHGSLSAETGTSWLSEWENEFPASVLRSVLKYGKKQFPVDENKRDTYRFPLSFRNEPSSLAVFEGERKQLVEVDNAYLEHSYARSIARFAADLGPVVWKIALKKIESALPIELKFGPGWIGENEVSRNEKSLFCEEVIPNPAAYDLTISRLLPQSISGSNSVGSDKFFMQGREEMETLARLATHNELSSLNSNVVGSRTMTSAPFQFQQNSAIKPWINGSNNGRPESYILPQMGISPPTTLMGRSSQAEASVPPQMLGVASTSNTAIVPVGINDTDSSEPNLLMNTSSSDYGNFLPHGSSGFGLFRAPALGFVGEASLQGWAMPHNQDSHHPFPSDLNERFRAPGSPTSLVQPDFALQLTMGR